ncbi:MAG: hypothetical protein CSA38_02320 [Flavobacteriales bacterium]|nr:MAG: hypothetical protein CSA38_02320 [Flavobacteriales bacterium]
MQIFIHYFLHFGIPLIFALIFYRKKWKKAYFILLLTMLIDLDHLMANPIFEANRCSINYHPLHTYYAGCIYLLLIFFKNPFRLIGIGLLWHLLTDLIDCMMTYSTCPSCLQNAPAIDLLAFIYQFFN